MCELVVWAYAGIPEQNLHPMRYAPGDVIEVRQDGSTYGTSEMEPGNPFRIVVFPGTPERAAQKLVETTATQRRHTAFNHRHSALPKAFHRWWQQADGTKFYLAMSLTDLHMPRAPRGIIG